MKWKTHTLLWGRVADLWADSSRNSPTKPSTTCKGEGGAKRLEVQVIKIKRVHGYQADAKRRSAWAQDSGPTWGRWGVRMALRGQVSGRGGPTGRRNGTQRHGVQRDRQWPGAAQSLDLEEGRLGSEKELGHLTKGHEGQGE